jgi:uncharacterized protein
MTALFLTVLVASFVGSPHCAGMCGAFVAFAIGAGEPGVKHSRTKLLALYQAGRLLTYAALGALAGALGASIDLAGRLAGLQRAAAVLAGAMMVGFGAFALLRFAGLQWHGPKVPASWTAMISAGHRQAMRYSPPSRALATGLLTTLLPCGFLWMFVVTAAGSGHAWTGAALLAVFWLGTLPALSIVAVGLRWLAKPLTAALPAVMACAIMFVGVYTIVARAEIKLPGPKVIHGPGLTPEELLDQIKGINHTQLPCCETQASEDAGGAK